MTVAHTGEVDTGPRSRTHPRGRPDPSACAFRFGIVSYPGGARHSAHYHDDSSIFVLLSGGVMETVGNRTRFGAPGDVVAKAPGLLHRDHFAPGGARALWIRPAPWLLRDLGIEPVAFGWSWLQSPEVARTSFTLTRALCSALRNGPGLDVELDAVEAAVVEEHALLLLESIAQWPSPPAAVDSPSWLKTVRDLIHDGFPRSASLRVLAKQVERHPCHVARVFRKQFGCSIGIYTRRLRLQRATSLLLETERPLSEVALASGFLDQPHFNRVFREALGLTPGEFRRSLHGSPSLAGPQRFQPRSEPETRASRQ